MDYLDLKNRLNIDRLSIMLEFMKVVSSSVIDKDFDNFVSFASKQIKREINSNERLKLLEGFLNFVKSEEGSNERVNSIEYIVEFNFLENENDKKESPEE